MEAVADSIAATLEREDIEHLVVDVRGNVGGNNFLNRPLFRRILTWPRLDRPGALFVLTDRGTFSAAVMLVADLEKRTPAVIVGEKTGGAPNSHGDSRRVVLPHTGITVRVATLYWQSSGPQDRRDGIEPHVPVPVPFADWRAGRDPALERVLALTAPASSPEGRWRGAIGIESSRVPLALVVTRAADDWRVRARSTGMGLDDAAVAATVVGGELRCTLTAGSAWELRLHPTAGAMTGVARYKGSWFPVVLEREP
jgi:hypothetical protein